MARGSRLELVKQFDLMHLTETKTPSLAIN